MIQIQSNKQNIKSLFNPELDKPAKGEYPNIIMDNFQNLSIGGAKYRRNYRPRCMRTFIIKFGVNIYGLKDQFIKAPKIRT